MKINKLFFVIAAFVLFSSFVNAQTTSASTYTPSYTTSYSSSSAYSVRHGTTPSFQTYYGSQASTYWPILGDRETCEAREDVLLNMAPFGCQPSVVRSDLLAEQDVPVFCQIDAVKINPLIDISQIRSINFAGQYPAEVSGTGFHPARAALRTQDTLLGSPLINNVGYAVVILKRQPDESKLPDSVNVTLQADIDYVSGNAYGVGRAEFLLAETSDGDWETEKLKQTFWNGRYSLRADYVDENMVEVSIYQGDVRANTVRVEKGKSSPKIYVPGMYCRAGLEIFYDEYTAAKNKARIEVASGNDMDVFDVYEGSRFLDDRCRVERIRINEDGETGNVTGVCRNQRFVLELTAQGLNLDASTNLEGIEMGGILYEIDLVKEVYHVEIKGISESRDGDYYLNESNDIIKSPDISIFVGNNYGSSVDASDKEWVYELYGKMRGYKIEDIALETNFTTNAVNSSKYFGAAISDYETVADSYGFELEGYYGMEALERAITLAGIFGNGNIKAGLINKYVKQYPNSERAAGYLDELSLIRDIDYSLAIEAIEFDENVKTVRLVSLDKPSNSSSVELLVEGKQVNLAIDQVKPFFAGTQSVGNITLLDARVDEATVGVYCLSNGTRWSGLQRYTLRLNEPARQPICGLNVVLGETSLEKVAKVRLVPSAEGTQTKTNLTIFIGIEKRAIQLTPSKVEEKIERLNKSIEKWTDINEKLGNVVSGMKAACFATAGVLNVKNFLTGASGAAIARQDIMQGENGWTNWCRDQVAAKAYVSTDQCYLDNSDKIDADVAARTQALNAVNDRIKSIQSKPELITENGAFGKTVDTAGVRKELANDITSRYGNRVINLNGTKWQSANGTSSNSVTVSELLSKENVDSGLMTTDDIRDLYVGLELQDKGGNTVGRQGQIVSTQLEDIAKRTNSNMIVDSNFKKSNAKVSEGYPPSAIIGATNQQKKYLNVVPVTDEMRATHKFSANVTHIAVVEANAGAAEARTGKSTTFQSDTYYLGLNGDSTAGVYKVQEVASGTGKVLAPSEIAEFNTVYGVGPIESIEKISYSNTIVPSDRKVRYFETDPYKGMPAIVPFNYREGWYAATRQNLPGSLGAFATGGSGVGTYQSSGRVTSYWLCNVGTNGRIEFNTGYGDDLCQQINVNTGQELNLFPGMDRTKAAKLIADGQTAIEQAATQYKSGSGYAVRILGEQYQAGEPEIGALGTQCQDFMSPKDCLLMFNVCDPVVCPSSRCDFGGTYPVANVAQQGIIGSIFLCLPNAREGIVIPVCLTGIHAGIDGLISIMESYRDCLTTNLETGEMVGICDEVYSIYLCEFFWNQVAPVLNVLLPKMVELAYGQGARGGAEYLSVQAAWQNMENSIDYFTQSYAANSMTAFQMRSVEEAGTQFCRSFASVKAPTAFESLIEPDSPPQFHAWFDQKKFTDVTVPATSQYKVFYHIFAGNDQGVYYNVYLKNPPQSGYYSVSQTVAVASGYIAKGESADETKDFTAPEGYKELCVRINNDEECGFGQVSTSFAVNYLRDEFVSDELKNTNIQSESECISGSNSAGSLLNPNLQAGVEETISPEVYNRGVVRICATQNPGSGTDSSRFLDVGNCGDVKIRCWLDQRSVEQALTKNNIGLKNETLSYLSNHSIAILQDRGEIFTESQAEDELMELKSGITELRNRNGDEVFGSTLLARADSIENMLIYNNHRAQLYLITGEINEIIALKLKANLDQVKRTANENSGVDLGSGGTGSGSDVGGTDSSFETELDLGSLENAVFKTSYEGPGEVANQEGGLIFTIPAQEGSGFFINSGSEGLRGVTAFHNLKGNSLDLSPQDTTQKYNSNLVNSDPEKDIALLQTAILSDRYPSVSLGNSANVKEGDEVFVLGYGAGKQTIESRIGKIISIRTIENRIMFVTDVVVEKGFSGSPLLDKNGLVIGIVLLANSTTWHGVALPIDDVKSSFGNMLLESSSGNLPDEEPEVLTCGSCGKGVSNLCDINECSTLGSCYFTNNFFVDSCLSCDTINLCIDYTNKETCEQNMCKLKVCAWDEEAGICEVKSIVEPEVVTPEVPIAEQGFYFEEDSTSNILELWYRDSSENSPETYTGIFMFLDGASRAVHYQSDNNVIGTLTNSLEALRVRGGESKLNIFENVEDSSFDEKVSGATITFVEEKYKITTLESS